MSEQRSIADLMSSDPLGLSAQDLDTIIEDLRKSRSRFVLVDDKKAGTPAARKSKAQTERESRADLISKTDLDDLLSGL